MGLVYRTDPKKVNDRPGQEFPGEKRPLDSLPGQAGEFLTSHKAAENGPTTHGHLRLPPGRDDRGRINRTLKARKGSVDFDGRVIAQLDVFIIPTGSQVSLVQKYDTPYQPGLWQVTRALGDEGMTALDITMEWNNRDVKIKYNRELSSVGAKGQFSIKVDLCSGFPTIPFL